MFVSKVGSVCQCYRSFCKVKLSTCSALQGSKDTQRASKIMNRFLGNTKSRKRKFYVLPAGGTPEFFDYVSSHKTPTKVNHRLVVLNKVFMRHITDIMSTGEISLELSNRGVQISKVSVTPTFHQINVHWLSSGTDDDIVTQNLLTEFAPKLRHELSQLKVIGVVPKIQFIKDSSYYKYLQVENILTKIDFGDDFERTSLGHDWKSEYSSQTPPDLTNKSDSAESSSSTSEQPDEILPLMRMDVFGLKHDIIMNKVTVSLEKAKALHRKDPSKFKFPSSNVNGNEEVNIIDEKERKKLFQEYFRKRLIERKKAARDEKTYNAENALRQEEMENRYAQEILESFDDGDCEDFDTNDSYIDNYDYNFPVKEDNK